MKSEMSSITRLENIMENYLFTIPSDYEPDYSENCKGGQKVQSKITTRRDILLIETLVLLIFFVIVFVILPPSAMSASTVRECCKGTGGQGDTQQCCKSSCTCGTSDSGSEKAQPGQCQCYKDVKCFNVCVESGYTCKHCEDACSYRK